MDAKVETLFRLVRRRMSAAALLALLLVIETASLESVMPEVDELVRYIAC
jgi:hypothetical protein